MLESIILFFKNLFSFGGGKHVSSKHMEDTADEMQERFDLDETEIPEVFRNRDKSKWRDEKALEDETPVETIQDTSPVPDIYDHTEEVDWSDDEEFDSEPKASYDTTPEGVTFDDESFNDGEEK